jgi:hypothetical protein
MKTIRSYGNSAEANFARSLLESAGVQASLADELAFTMEPPLVPWGIRLQVPDDEVARALEILDQGSSFVPLAEEFEPPVSEQDEVITPAHDPELGRWAFIEGGICGLALYGVLKLLARWLPHLLPQDVHLPIDLIEGLTSLDLRDLFVPFCIGGVFDIAVRGFIQRARRLRALRLEESE